MRTIGTDEPTAASVWRSVAGTRVEDHLLEWPPDVFALTDTLLGRSEAYRFALSPPDEAEWPPSEVPGWPDAVVDVGRQWSSWVEDRHAPVPDLLAREWKILRDAIDSPFTDLGEAHDHGRHKEGFHKSAIGVGREINFGMAPSARPRCREPMPKVSPNQISRLCHDRSQVC